MSNICDNRKAHHEYFIEERLEVGMVLLGWEVKSIRAGKAQINDAHVIEHEGALLCLGSHISPLSTAGTHVPTDPTRTRKLLAKRKEISRLMGKVKLAGYTLIPLNLHWKNGKVKMEIGLAKGKKLHDKRQSQQNREIARSVERAMKTRNRPAP
jgi:SsrA-binding protein